MEPFLFSLVYIYRKMKVNGGVDVHRTVPDSFVDHLKEKGLLNDEEVGEVIEKYNEWLNSCFHNTHYNLPQVKFRETFYTRKSKLKV